MRIETGSYANVISDNVLRNAANCIRIGSTETTAAGCMTCVTHVTPFFSPFRFSEEHNTSECAVTRKRMYRE